MTKKRDVYDVADWYPVKPEIFVRTLGECALTRDNPTELKLTVEDLNGSIRMVIHADVLESGAPGGLQSKSAIEPILMILYTDENQKAICMERQMELATE